MIEEKLQNNIIYEKICFHCGQNCLGSEISLGDKYFCCAGCKTVYEILYQNNLCQYYNIEKNPGNKINKNVSTNNFEFLDDPDVKEKLVSFSDGEYTIATFFISQMHCSSCIWLLENLYKFNSGIIQSQVNFVQKQLTIRYSEKNTSLKKVVELLNSIGYMPELNFSDLVIDERKRESSISKKLYYKIGIAGFCFGNIMLLSFPEYLSFVNNIDTFLRRVFAYVITVLSLPVFFYCSSEYFNSAYKSLKRKVINIDFPLSLGIAVLFLRSLYEILFNMAPGYMDSLAGLVFFLLIGKLFQEKTFETLNFERSYKSYFPVSVTIKKDNKEFSIAASKLQIGDTMIIRNDELVPSDAVLMKGKGYFDYSFVTGESKIIEKQTGDVIYAGGRQKGQAIELEVIKETSQSYLTQLWNQDFSKKNENKLVVLSNVISKYFTIVVLFIAFTASLFWMHYSLSVALNVLTSVLIVACPCALALSTPFTFGNTLRIFGRNKFYLKNTSVVEKLANIDSIVFDKTGTITNSEQSTITFSGRPLSHAEEVLVSSALRNSSHPLSRYIFAQLNTDALIDADYYNEIPGKGIESIIANNKVSIGSKDFVFADALEATDKFNTDKCNNVISEAIDTTVFISINGKNNGFYKISNSYREALEEVINALKNYKLSVLSGDNSGEMIRLKKIFKEASTLLFRQAPEDKLNYISSLQLKGQRVLMIGDGLNDAGALLKSDVGISISEDITNFSPACDAILDSTSFSKIGSFLDFSKSNLGIIKLNFIISLLYNIAGLSFAIKGNLSPIVAAVLMPLSSVTAVTFTTLATNFMAKRKGLL
ncbi:MAG: heavy metal translocating P-type ATPase metal-binding domain-containing protein [Bacteroidota bacterium]|nr:heavy metal translocating P-type ATPase metal-binding domain-containing protein [Bacteroidota bacterium]